MPAERSEAVLEEYLGRVRSHLPLVGSRDIVRELESSIRDRVDELAEREQRAPDDDELVSRALGELGEPEIVARAYTPERSLVGPEDFRSFLTSTAVVFAVHLALIGIATTLGRSLRLGPAQIAPAGAGLADTAAAVLHALLLDVGLMVLVFAVTGETRRRLTPRAGSRRVDASPRTALGRIATALLAGLLLGVLRDRVFVVMGTDAAHPLFTRWFGEALPFVMTVLCVSVLSDALYIWLGETRLSLVVDAIHGAAGLAVMLVLMGGGPILSLPALPEFSAFYLPVNEFLAQLGVLVLAFLAMLFAVKTVRRLVRCSQV